MCRHEKILLKIHIVNVNAKYVENITFYLLKKVQNTININECRTL